MEQHYKQFEKNLYNCISDFNRYTPNEGANEFLMLFDKLDMGKVMLRYLNIMRDHQEKLNNRDESIFSQKLNIFPKIDMSVYWNKFTTGQKNKMWTYLQILYVQSELVLNFKESSEPSSDKNKIIKSMISDVDKYTDTNNDQQTNLQNNLQNNLQTNLQISLQANQQINKLDFNPYIGIGNTNIEYNVNDILSGPESFPDAQQLSTPGLGSIAGMVGLDKMLNLNELSEQLKNMNKEDIDAATDNIKGLLGGNIDEGTSSLISDMLHNIKDELKKDDIASGNPMDTIIKIAETVAEKMKPRIDSEGIDMNKLLTSTQNLTNNCKDSEGNSMFSQGMNPFNLLGKLVNQSGELNEEDCMKQCNDMLKNMGLDGVDLNGLDMSNINMNTLQKLQKQLHNRMPNKSSNKPSTRLNNRRPNKKKNNKKNVKNSKNGKK